MRARITKKNMCFFLPSARIRLLPISDKKIKFISVDKKTLAQLHFYFAYFFVALINFFKKGQKFVLFCRPH